MRQVITPRNTAPLNNLRNMFAPSGLGIITFRGGYMDTLPSQTRRNLNYLTRRRVLYSIRLSKRSLGLLLRLRCTSAIPIPKPGNEFAGNYDEYNEQHPQPEELDVEICSEADVSGSYFLALNSNPAGTVQPLFKVDRNQHRRDDRHFTFTPSTAGRCRLRLSRNGNRRAGSHGSRHRNAGRAAG